ncbi:MAG: FKBP-type peptidyl-prolyl cis-trans isomerase [Ignavibacteriales bacterium]|nr:FKBP-type peptidyl-prolyl cis-trans isomerase [Ignavibacteriales bacterium]
MKYFAALLLGCTLLVTGMQAQKSKTPKTASAGKSTSALTTQKEQISYILGFQIGSNFKQQNIDISPEIILRGLADAVGGKQMALPDSVARIAYASFQQEMMKKQQETLGKVAIKNKAEGDAFLAANKTKDSVVTLPSGLQYKVITPGTGKSPAATDTVVTHYRGTLIDGTEFDNSYSRNEPATFPVNGVIKGWIEALQLMKEGAKWQLFIPAELAYGERPRGQVIGPNSTLIFDIELIKVK